MAKRKSKKSKQRSSLINTITDFAFALIIIIIPIVVLMLHVLGLQIPKTAFGIYISIAYPITGLLCILFTYFGLFGFGDEGWNFSRILGFEWVNKKQAKKHTYSFGLIMMMLGIIFAVLTMCR